MTARLVHAERRSYHAMMSVFLDGDLLEGAGSDLNRVLATARDQLAASGRIVVEVQLNGETLTHDVLNQQGNTNIQDAELRLYSADLDELAVSTLQQVRVELEEAKQDQIEAAELLQQNERVPAMQKVGHAMEIWQQLHQSVSKSAQLLGTRFDEIENPSIDDLMQRSLEQLRSLREALVAGDTVALADALGYEWSGLCDQWDRALNAMVQHIESRSRI